MNTKALWREKKIYRCKQQKIYTARMERQGWIVQTTGSTPLIPSAALKDQTLARSLPCVMQGCGFGVELTELRHLIHGPAPQLWLLAQPEEEENQTPQN